MHEDMRYAILHSLWRAIDRACLKSQQSYREFLEAETDTHADLMLAYHDATNTEFHLLSDMCYDFIRTQFNS